MKFNNSITYNRLIELVHYEYTTGVFTALVSSGSRRKSGDTLGTKNASGHIVIQLDKVNYLAHRLAWLYCFREWPEEIIDHIDQNPSNNSLDNLRESTHSKNSFNTGLKSNNTSGFRGVFFDKRRGTYYSQIKVNRIKKWLGSFKTAEEAFEAYKKAAKEYFGENFNENTSIG